MPEISRFFGIIIKMFFDDHNPPHFHAEYSGNRVVIDIRTKEVLEGTMPMKQLKLIQAWASIYEVELLENFEGLRKEIKAFKKIDPLA